MRDFFLSFVLFCFMNLNGQISNFVSTGVGLSLGSPINYNEKRVFLNINNIFNYKLLVVKNELFFAPNTIFGQELRAMHLLGFTSPIKNFISWHMTFGVGYLSVTKKEYIYSSVHGNELYTYRDNYTPTMNTGVIINPLKTKKILFSLESNIVRENIDTGISNSMAFPITYSINFIINLNIKKNENI